MAYSCFFVLIFYILDCYNVSISTLPDYLEGIMYIWTTHPTTKPHYFLILSNSINSFNKLTQVNKWLPCAKHGVRHWECANKQDAISLSSKMLTNGKIYTAIGKYNAT